MGSEAEVVADKVHRTKTILFRERVLSGAVPPRPGVPELVDELGRVGIRIAIATTGRRAWVEPLVRSLFGAQVVEVMVTGDDVQRLKPDPQAYLLALGQLRMTAEDVLAVEDSAVGLLAARRAALATVVVTNCYTAVQDFDGAAAVLPAFDGAELLSAMHCMRIHRRWWDAQC
jgi:HAD superfamily hydrolase (TIGR01509 family)